MNSPSKLVTTTPQYRKLMNADNKKRYADAFDEIACDKCAEELWKKRKDKIARIDKKIESKASIVYAKARSNPKYHKTSWYVICFLVLGLLGMIGYAAYSSALENDEINMLANDIGLDIKHKGGN